MGLLQRLYEPQSGTILLDDVRVPEAAMLPPSGAGASAARRLSFINPEETCDHINSAHLRI